MEHDQSSPPPPANTQPAVRGFFERINFTRSSPVPESAQTLPAYAQHDMRDLDQRVRECGEW